jgi:hypothetical protein
MPEMSVSFSRASPVSPYRQRVLRDWHRSAVGCESTLHQISPYIGKLKSTIAASLISQFTSKGDVVYDPFSGCGTVALEAWIAGCRVYASDLNPYAHLLTRAKLSPYTSLQNALDAIESVGALVANYEQHVDLRSIPKWVRNFFHPETLREIISWNTILRERDLFFLRACLLGILHHQRPGFLSYPSCHTVPYLRINKFPSRRFPNLYDYRPLRCRLESKVKRALNRLPQLDFTRRRQCFLKSAAGFIPPTQVDAIITSPPYMRRLDYGRDNRLRLWFLGVSDWKSLDKRISPRESDFMCLLRQCFAVWKKVLRPSGRCILVVGDSYSRLYGMSLPEVLVQIALNEIGGYRVVSKHTEKIPDLRRVRRGFSGNQLETVLVLERKKRGVYA